MNASLNKKKKKKKEKKKNTKGSGKHMAFHNLEEI
jgi:hypothetical protein